MRKQRLLDIFENGGLCATREGKNATIISVDADIFTKDSTYPVIALIEGNGEPSMYTLEGKFYKGEEDCDDLLDPNEVVRDVPAYGFCYECYGCSYYIFSTEEKRNQSLDDCIDEDDSFLLVGTFETLVSQDFSFEDD